MIKIDPAPRFSLSPYLHMQFAEPLGTADTSVDAAWDYLNDRWQPCAIEILKKLAPPMIRWGGCFASYYHWREAVGPRSERKPMYNLCWDGIYPNQVGTAEFVELCRTLNAEPLMCVNMESDGRRTWAYPKPGEDRLGTAQEAAEWVAYCNDPDHPLRRSHGAKDPYNIRYWQIGNETSFPYTTAGVNPQKVCDGFNVQQTIDATCRFAKAMRQADPDLKLIAWGDSNWAPEICENCGDLVDLIAFHYHYVYPDTGENGPIHGVEYRKDFDKTWECLMNTHNSVAETIANIRQQVAPYGKRLAMTEGHYQIDGRNRGDVLASWATGVAYARILNLIARNGDVLDIATCADFFGNRWQVNAVILPTPAWSGKAYLMPVGEVMSLFSHHTGESAIGVNCSDSSADITASRTEDRIYLHIANTDKDHALSLPISVENYRIDEAVAWEINADPQQEITQCTPDIFQPQKRIIDPEKYTLSPAAVAAVELKVSPIQ